MEKRKRKKLRSGAKRKKKEAIDLENSKSEEGGDSSDSEILGFENGWKKNEDVTVGLSKYHTSDRPPFIVMMEKNDNFRIEDMEVAKLLRGQNIKPISIRKVTHKKVKVNCADVQAANRIINNVTWGKLGLNAYIPRNILESEGVIKGVSLQMNDEDLKELDCEVKIMKAERLMRWDREKQERTPSYSVKITFRGTRLPKEVDLMGVKRTVEHYIPNPRICRNCLNYGHSEIRCRGVRVCNTCAAEHEGTCRETRPCCRHCKGEHTTTDPRCPERMRQREIKEIITIQKVEYQEALKIQRERANKVDDFPSLSARLNVNQETQAKQMEELTRMVLEVRQAHLRLKKEINDALKEFNNNKGEFAVDALVTKLGAIIVEDGDDGKRTGSPREGTINEEVSYAAMTKLNNSSQNSQQAGRGARVQGSQDTGKGDRQAKDSNQIREKELGGTQDEVNKTSEGHKERDNQEPDKVEIVGVRHELDNRDKGAYQELSSRKERAALGEKVGEKDIDIATIVETWSRGKRSINRQDGSAAKQIIHSSGPRKEGATGGATIGTGDGD